MTIADGGSGNVQSRLVFPLHWQLDFINSHPGLQIQEPQLFKEIAYHTRRSIRGFTPHQLSQLMWAFSKVNHTGMPGYTEVIVRQAEARLADFEPKDLVQLLGALSALDELSLVSFRWLVQTTQG